MFTIFSSDSLILYDGDSTSSLMLGIYCGDSNPPIHISSSFFIHFQSVISIGKLGLGGYGFKLKYHLSGKIKKKTWYR